jgi:ABC-type Fe2+-enterobactin transport system substrate-binding protein
MAKTALTTGVAVVIAGSAPIIASANTLQNEPATAGTVLNTPEESAQKRYLRRI